MQALNCTLQLTYVLFATQMLSILKAAGLLLTASAAVEMTSLPGPFGASTQAAPLFPRTLGDVAAVYALIERVLPGTSSHFALSLSAGCPGVTSGVACFSMSDAADQVSIAATTASELTGAIGVYLRELCNMTIGWPRGGGSSMTIPAIWPRIGATSITRARSTPFSYMVSLLALLPPYCGIRVSTMSSSPSRTCAGKCVHALV